MEYRFLAKDGSVVWVLDHASLISRAETGDPASFQGVMLDITARKDAESKAEAAEDRFRTLAERGPAVVYSFELAYDDEDSSPRLSVQYVSPQAAELVRYPIDRWLGKAEVWFEMVHPDDRERCGTSHGTQLANRETVVDQVPHDPLRRVRDLAHGCGPHARAGLARQTVRPSRGSCST